jgi:DNA-binding beta-propeller fold protein YncE
MSAIMKLAVTVRISASAALQYLRSVVPAALLLSLSVLGIGSNHALAQTRQSTTDDAHTFTAPAKLMTLPGMGRGEQHEPPTGTLNYPYGLALDSSGNLYAANVFGGVNIYSGTTFKLVNTITAGTDYPAAVGVAFGGNIYVANNGGNNITIYNPSLQQIGTISDPTLVNPSSMYIDAANDVWALDATGTVHLYLDNGATAGSIATGGTAIGPWGPNVTVWGVPDGAGAYSEVYQDLGETLHYGPFFNGAFVGGSPEAGGEAQDSLFQQYVTNNLANKVEIWSTSGTEEIGAFTTPDAPFGIAVDSVHKRIFVSLTTSNEIQVYSTTAPYKLLRTIK